MNAIMLPTDIKCIRESIYNFFLENYENEKMALEKSESITQQILELIKSINIKFDKKNNEHTTKEIHTLKHLLLYADLDEISDMCQELENDMRVGIFNHQLKEKIVSKIVK